MSIVYDNIRNLAKEHDISLAELERRTNITRGLISSWREADPSSSKLEKIADYFHVSIDFLLGRTKNRDFTRKDELDIQKTLNDLIYGLSNENSLSYMKSDGESLDREDAEFLKKSLEDVVRQSKYLAKRKFATKKYRKED